MKPPTEIVPFNCPKMFFLARKRERDSEWNIANIQQMKRKRNNFLATLPVL